MATISTEFQTQDENYTLSASVDPGALTEAVFSQTNSVMPTSTIESNFITPSSAITEDLQFNADNKNIFFGDLINYQYEIFSYTIPTVEIPKKDSPSGSEFSWNIDQLNAGLFFDLSLSSGTYDLSYPIASSIDLPSNVNTGKSFTIDTNFDLISNDPQQGAN